MAEGEVRTAAPVQCLLVLQRREDALGYRIVSTAGDTPLNDLWQSRFPMLRIELAVEPPHDARFFCEALGVDTAFGCAHTAADAV